MRRFTAILFFCLLMATPLLAQQPRHASDMQDTVSTVHATGRTVVVGARLEAAAGDSVAVADAPVATLPAGTAGSSAAAKMLFMKKICWLPFRRATYS